MKYIRTKNGIYEVVGFDDECIIPSPIIKMNGKLTHCSDYKNCKQTDTIEELCDEFVVVNLKYNTHRFYDKTKSDWTLQTYACSPTHIVYGCIWTDKGLIYVAKMNENGVLCLI